MLAQRIRTIVVEDEEEGMDNLLLKIERSCSELEIVATCFTGESAIERIRKLRPQLVFLDIQLGTMSGFDVLEQVPRGAFEVIITTAFDDYAIQAIKANAVDYLLKPVRPAELKQATASAVHRIQQRSSVDRILIPDGNSQLVIHTREIMYCLADNVNCYIYRQQQRPLLAVKTLKAIQAMLPQTIFHRVSRSAIVNLDYVASFHRADGGYLVMKDRREISVAKSRLDDFLKKLGGSF